MGFGMKGQRGFTLIELMIVVAIMAIMASIAFNAFTGAGQDSRRVRAIADLSALNDAIARHYQTAFSYNGIQGQGATAAGTSFSAGALAAARQITLNTEYTYAITIGDAVGATYRLVAVPTTGRTQVGDGAMMMDQAGRRCIYPHNDAPDFATCPSTF